MVFQAVAYAERACELTHYGVTIFVGTLAAAYAEAGRFDDAIATAQKACALARRLVSRLCLRRTRNCWPCIAPTSRITSPPKSPPGRANNDSSGGNQEFILVPKWNVGNMRAMFIYALTIFTGAFLLFLVQPLIGNTSCRGSAAAPASGPPVCCFPDAAAGWLCLRAFISRRLKPRTRPLYT